jgi:hypothetical protein
MFWQYLMGFGITENDVAPSGKIIVMLIRLLFWESQCCLQGEYYEE